MTERPRIALRQPRSLQPEQMGQLTVCTPADAPRVSAWILWEDGVEELVPAQAVAWTKRAVRLRFGAPRQHEVWVWAGAVERRVRLSLVRLHRPRRYPGRFPMLDFAVRG